MSRRWWFALAVLASSVAVAASGCGGDDTAQTPGGDGGTGDGTTGDDGGGSGDGGICKPTGMQCAMSGDCCTGNCDAQLKVCANPIGTCKSPGSSCGTSNECCTFVC